ncbi:hypothetical protein EfmAA96_17250 [Enterococcus faecium]|nr:hypothetical protein EfmAA96_17250 [Enterococcus faecium]
MKLAGWFDGSSGIMFGRSAAEDLLDYKMKVYLREHEFCYVFIAEK